MLKKELLEIRRLKKLLKLSFIGCLSLFIISCGSDDDDELDGNWVELSDFEGIPRSDAVGVSTDDRAYVVTGYDGDDRLTDMWEYNPGQDYWIQKADFPGVARNGAVGFGLNNKVYVGTGYDGTDKLNDFYEFDPTANVWSQKADFGGSERYGAIAMSIGDKGYIGTGYDGNYLKDFWEYDPLSDSWTQKVSVGGSKRRDGLSFVINGEGYVCGGVDNGVYEPDFWKYNPSDDMWTRLRDISDETDEDFDDDYLIERTNGVAFVMNGKAYVATGGKSSTGGDVWEYNPSTDLWEEKTALEGAFRTEAVAFTINDIGFVTTGRNSSYYFDDVWRFEPVAEYDEYD